MRPFILKTWPAGRPFYCGKTVHPVERRFAQHRAASYKPSRNKTAMRINSCGDDVRVVTMEIVPAGDDWQAREKRWIEIIQFCFPYTTNVSAGGQDGMVGYKHSAKTRKRISHALRNSLRGRLAEEGRRHREMWKRPNLKLIVKQRAAEREAKVVRKLKRSLQQIENSSITC